MDPMTILMVAGALFSIWSAVQQRAAATTPEQIKASDDQLAQRWAAAEALLAPLAPQWRERLAAYRAGQDPYKGLTMVGDGPQPAPVVTAK